MNGCDLSALTLRGLYAGERTLATDWKESWLEPNGGLNEVAKQLIWHETCKAMETRAKD